MGKEEGGVMDLLQPSLSVTSPAVVGTAGSIDQGRNQCGYLQGGTVYPSTVPDQQLGMFCYKQTHRHTITGCVTYGLVSQSPCKGHAGPQKLCVAGLTVPLQVKVTTYSIQMLQLHTSCMCCGPKRVQSQLLNSLAF